MMLRIKQMAMRPARTSLGVHRAQALWAGGSIGQGGTRDLKTTTNPIQGKEQPPYWDLNNKASHSKRFHKYWFMTGSGRPLFTTARTHRLRLKANIL